ncbi:phosphoenolpyruvate synthase, partial [Candidatus Woesearchaeota archaeon CG_4_10_14_0_2_um_filter_57_5]
MTKHIVWFHEIGKDDVPVAGGKGANLGEMSKGDLPIPPGFIVTAPCYGDFIDRTGIRQKILDMLKPLDVDNTTQLQDIAKTIQDLIQNTPCPEDIKQEIIDFYEAMSLKKGANAGEVLSPEYPFVACRSSATAEDLPEASFAGQQATFLNVKGPQDVVYNVQACWASLFTARAIYYRQKNDFDTSKVLIAVVVQKMVDSEVSGIMFTANPATNDASEIVVESVYGLGETIVSGSVNPNTFMVDKKSLTIKSAVVREQDWELIRGPDGGNIKRDIDADRKKRQIIDDKTVMEVARIGKRIEEHYGKPQDIEWAMEDGKVFIVQSRAITTLQKKDEQDTDADAKEAEEELANGKILVVGQTASPGAAFGPVTIIHTAEELDKVKKGDILVTEMTNPDMVPAMKRAAGIVTNEGGMTCHAAIVSREMGIPCVVGTEHATQVLKQGQIITVDATHGHVYAGELKIAHHHDHITSAASQAAPLETATKVKVICDLPDIAERAAKSGADGVGLVRMEFMIADGGVHPAQYIRENRDEDYIKLLMDGIGTIAKAFKDKPVWVRTSDIRTDEYRALKGGDQEPHETDPMIGWHAIRRGLDEPRILKAEFTAIKRLHDQGMKNVGIMVPFVIRTNELQAAKNLMREVGLEPLRDIDFGVMVETP